MTPNPAKAYARKLYAAHRRPLLRGALWTLLSLLPAAAVAPIQSLGMLPDALTAGFLWALRLLCIPLSLGFVRTAFLCYRTRSTTKADPFFCFRSGRRWGMALVLGLLSTLPSLVMQALDAALETLTASMAWVMVLLLLFAVVAAFWFWLRFFFAFYLYIEDESASLVSLLSRSAALSRGHGLFMLGYAIPLLLLSGAVTAFPPLIFETLVTGQAVAADFLLRMGGVLVSALLTWLLTPYLELCFSGLAHALLPDTTKTKIQSKG